MIVVKRGIHEIKQYKKYLLFQTPFNLKVSLVKQIIFNNMLPKVCEKMFSIVRRNGLFATKSPKFIGLYLSTHTDSHAVVMMKL